MKKALVLAVALIVIFVAQTSAQTEVSDGPFSEAKLKEVVANSGIEKEASPPRIILPLPKQTVDWKFLSVAVMLHGAMIMDLKSTYYALDRCPMCFEGNPYARPFVERGPATAYIAATVFQSVMMYISYRMQKSDDKFLRKTWFVLPMITTGSHALLTNRNYNLGRQSQRQK